MYKKFGKKTKKNISVSSPVRDVKSPYLSPYLFTRYIRELIGDIIYRPFLAISGMTA